MPAGRRSTTFMPDAVERAGMSDLEPAVREFLEDAETVFDEYEQGYVDADVALQRLTNHVDNLEAAVEEN